MVVPLVILLRISDDQFDWINWVSLDLNVTYYWNG